jgi:hypothetical protein
MEPNPLVAFQGEVEILNATWSLNDGRRVELRICGNAYQRQHPFKRFQQKRNGHVGSRFHGSFARTSTGELLSTMELMLAAWKDSSSVGQSVTFWLDDEPDTHPFCGCQPRKAQIPGDMFALVLVEINDDEQPIDQVRRAAIEQRGDAGVPTGVRDSRAAPRGAGEAAAPNARADAGPEADRGAARGSRKLSSSAHLLLISPMFCQYLKETKPNLVKSWTPTIAREYAKQLIEVESLSDLDRDRGAVERYDTMVRRPYDRWRSQDPR